MHRSSYYVAILTAATLLVSLLPSVVAARGGHLGHLGQARTHSKARVLRKSSRAFGRARRSRSGAPGHIRLHVASGRESRSIVHVRKYLRGNGTLVRSHDRTSPNHTKHDNWSTKGNVNPETWKPGTKPCCRDQGTKT